MTKHSTEGTQVGVFRDILTGNTNFENIHDLRSALQAFSSGELWQSGMVLCALYCLSFPLCWHRPIY